MKNPYLPKHGKDYFPDLYFKEYFSIVKALGGSFAFFYMVRDLYRRKCDEAHIATQIDYNPTTETEDEN